jgi:hypothetical protein
MFDAWRSGLIERDFIKELNMPNIRALSVSLLASFFKTKSELRDGKPVLMRLAELNFIDDGPGKGRRQHQLRYSRLEVGEVCDRNAC